MDGSIELGASFWLFELTVHTKTGKCFYEYMVMPFRLLSRFVINVSNCLSGLSWL